jgi:hypothetical protein
MVWKGLTGFAGGSQGLEGADRVCRRLTGFGGGGQVMGYMSLPTDYLMGNSRTATHQKWLPLQSVRPWQCREEVGSSLAQYYLPLTTSLLVVAAVLKIFLEFLTCKWDFVFLSASECRARE